MPFDGCVMVGTESGSPKISESFVSTAIVTAKSSFVTMLSGMVTGTSLIMTVTRAVSHNSARSQISYEKLSGPKNIMFVRAYSMSVPGRTVAVPLVGVMASATGLVPRSPSRSMSLASTSTMTTNCSNAITLSSMAAGGSSTGLTTTVTSAESSSPNTSLIV